MEFISFLPKRKRNKKERQREREISKKIVCLYSNRFVCGMGKHEMLTSRPSYLHRQYQSNDTI